MAKKTLLKGLLASVPFLFMVGCVSTPAETDKGTSVLDANANGLHEGAGYGSESERELLKRTVFYFDFNKSTVKEEFAPSLKAHAKYLAEHPTAKVRVEGHTDERGSREYNVALGERRAQAVARVLVMEGAAQHQVSTVSYGKEKPAVQGHDEAAWAMNRRAVIVNEQK